MSRFHVACEDMNLIFKDVEVKKVLKMHGSKSLFEIGKELKRDPDEVAVLVIDLAKRGKLQ